jgi:hypothetical protein
MIAYLMIMDFGLAIRLQDIIPYIWRKAMTNLRKFACHNCVLYVLYLPLLVFGICGIDYLISFYTKTLSPQDIAVAKKSFIFYCNVAIVFLLIFFTAVINSHEKLFFQKQ